MRVMGPGRNAVEIDGVTGRRYKGSDGVYDMHPADAAHITRIGGFIPGVNGPTSRGLGYACTACGFRAYFTTCSRCGGSAVKE
jgi:hypothetical protein